MRKSLWNVKFNYFPSIEFRIVFFHDFIQSKIIKFTPKFIDILIIERTSTRIIRILIQRGNLLPLSAFKIIFFTPRCKILVLR